MPANNKVTVVLWGWLSSCTLCDLVCLRARAPSGMRERVRRSRPGPARGARRLGTLPHDPAHPSRPSRHSICSAEHRSTPAGAALVHIAIPYQPSQLCRQQAVYACSPTASSSLQRCATCRARHSQLGRRGPWTSPSKGREGARAACAALPRPGQLPWAAAGSLSWSSASRTRPTRVARRWANCSGQQPP